MTFTRQNAGELKELVQTAHEPGRYLAGHFGNIVTFYWLSAGKPDAVDALMSLCDQVSEGGTSAFSAIHIVRPEAGLPDAEVRQLLGSGLQKYASVTGCIVVVTQGGGFWVSALQSIVTGMRMLVPMGAFLLRFVQTPEDLRGWFVSEHAARTGQTLDEERFLQSLNQMMTAAQR